MPVDAWSQVAAAYAPSSSGSAFVTVYLSGAYAINVSLSSATSSNANSIWLGSTGTAFSNGGYFNGRIADAQIHNTSLSANDIHAFYLEGIGGAPINIQNLVGRWPLNGNANDYSGNGNNSVPAGVIYTANRYSGYSAP